jgi:ASC-1-like (ASCH) protein
MDHIIHEGKLKEEYYTSVKEGKKIYEVRVNDDKRRKMKVGDIWIFSHNDEPSNAHSSHSAPHLVYNEPSNDHSALHHIQDEFDKPKIKTKIVDIKTYVTFEEAINDTDLSKLLPDIESIKEAIKIYEGFPHDEGTYKEGAKKYGVVRFKLDLVN